MKFLTVRSTAWLLGLLHLPPLAAGVLWTWQAGLAAMIALHALLLLATLRVHSTFFGSARRRVAGMEGKSLCLTIDDGPCPDTAALLDILDAHDARAVFFLIGERAAGRPDDVREILRRGHRIGNHTRTHPAGRFWSYGPRRQRQEISHCQETLRSLTGPTPRFFRAPAGFRNPFTAPVLRETGLEAWGWHARGFDTSSSDIPLILRRLTGNLVPGAILLVHEGQPHHPELLRRLLEKLTAEGWRCRLPETG
ncbi:MAG: polysaccharide deacetylase family protein [Verrucomicrobiota bacterium]